MKRVDYLLQRWRIAQAAPYIRQGARVLDIGCADGALFKQLGLRIGQGVGIDPELSHVVEVSGSRHRLLPGTFPFDLPPLEPFDAITMLALLEHIPSEQLAAVRDRCVQLLKPGGVLIVTVPSPLVDHLLHAMKFFRIVDGMDLDAHTGFDVATTPLLFSAGGLRVIKAKRFELGLNHLFVFDRPAA